MKNTKVSIKKTIHKWGTILRQNGLRRVLPLWLCVCLAMSGVLHVQATEGTSQEGTSQEEASQEEPTKSELEEIQGELEDVNNQIGDVNNELGELENNLDQAQQNHSALEQGKNEVETVINKLNSQYKSLTSQIAKVESDIAAKQSEIDVKEANIIAKRQAISDKEDEIAVIENSIEITAAKIVEAEIRLDEQYEAMKLRIQFMYENASAGQYLELLLDSDSFIDFLNRIEYIAAMLEYDEKMQVKMQETKANLDETKASLEYYQQELNVEKANLTAEKDALEAEYASLQESKKELDTLKATLKRQQTAVAAQQSTSAKELQQYIDELASSSDQISSYEDTIALKRQYYETLMQEKLRLEEEEARKMAEEEANNTGGSITEGDSGIDGDLEYDISDEELLLLAAIIYCEAGGECYEGKLGVGYVIMNRVRSSKYGNTITEVVYQKGQFSPVGSGRLALVLAMEQDPDVKGKVTESCWRAAREVLTGTSNVGESLYFRTHKPVPQLEENLKAAGIPYYIIEDHIFYHTWVKY